MVSYIRIRGKTVDGVFRKRLNRFLAAVEVNGRTFSSFLPNPGRMCELLAPGSKVILEAVQKGHRKTAFDLIGVIHGGGETVSVDSRVPNRLVFEALRNGDIMELGGFRRLKPEHAYGNTRFDFFLASESQKCLLEVKSCMLVKNGLAMFPDAPTKRGTRHVSELTRAKAEGYRSCILFLIQRTGVDAFTPNDDEDPKFAASLRAAVERGVEVYAYCSQFDGKKITLKNEVQVKLYRFKGD